MKSLKYEIISKHGYLTIIDLIFSVALNLKKLK